MDRAPGQAARRWAATANIEHEKGDEMNEMQCNHRVAGISRRAVTRATVGGLAAASLAAGRFRDAQAQETKTADEAVDLGPSRYVLSGGETEIAFVPAISADSAATLDYSDAALTLQLVRDPATKTEDFGEERNESLGWLVTALIDVVFDGYTRYLTLLVPGVNPTEDRSDVEISTFAILTTHWTSLEGPPGVTGALQTYEVVELTGVAEFAPA